MGKVTLNLSDKTENDLRDYVAKKYPRSIYGKLGEVSDKAIRYYLDHLEKTIFPDD